MEELLSLTKVKYLVQGHLDNKMQLCSNPSWRSGEGEGQLRNGDIGRDEWALLFLLCPPFPQVLSQHILSLVENLIFSVSTTTALVQANAMSSPDACSNS